MAPVTRRLISARRAAAVLASALMLLTGMALSSSLTLAANGNNGTLKIHEQGTPAGTENNDPKVCIFNVEAFNLDAAQAGYLVFSVQGGDGPTGADAGPFAFGPADSSGYFASQYFSLQPGHYKATLYGKALPNGTLADEKAKSKVFKVECAAPQPPPTTTSTATTITTRTGGATSTVITTTTTTATTGATTDSTATTSTGTTTGGTTSVGTTSSAATTAGSTGSQTSVSVVTEAAPTMTTGEGPVGVVAAATSRPLPTLPPTDTEELRPTTAGGSWPLILVGMLMVALAGVMAVRPLARRRR